MITGDECITYETVIKKIRLIQAPVYGLYRLQSIELQRVGHDWVTDTRLAYDSFTNLHFFFFVYQEEMLHQHLLAFVFQLNLGKNWGNSRNMSQ